MSLWKWPPGSHIGLFGFRTLNFSLALNIKSKFHITCVYEKKPIDFQQCHFQNGCLAAILDFSVSGLYRWHGFRSVAQVFFGISISNVICMLFVGKGQSLLIFRNVTFKMAAWWPYWIFHFLDISLTSVWLWISSPNFSSTLLMCMDKTLFIISNVTSKTAAWWPYQIFQFPGS